MNRAREIVGQDHPFSTSQFKTDGKSIFLEITRDLDEPELIDLKHKQGVFRRVVAPSLADLDFGPDGAERWWLLHGKKTIVADPERSFGQPRSEEHTSELQSLMRISYAVFCLKKKKYTKH